MLAILTTHPIQYQVPLWQALARDGRVPFEVWYLTDHGVGISHDCEFDADFVWDIDLLKGYPYRFVKAAPGATPVSFWKCRLAERFADRLRNAGVTVLWVQGWQVAAYWQAVWTARQAGIQVWLRGESNDLAPLPMWKRGLKSVLVGQLFQCVDQFLYIGSANRRLYESFGVPASRLHPGLYSVDNERFATQAGNLYRGRAELRKQWGIPESAACVLFCGKFIAKKRPFDVIAAVRQLRVSGGFSDLHLLFVGSGELEEAMRRESLPWASFTGFLNQTEICQAYVASDCLVLPSDFGETWGLVVNEAMAAGLPCVLSDRCGSAMDLGRLPGNRVFPCGDVSALAREIAAVLRIPRSPTAISLPEEFSFAATVSTVAALSAGSTS